MYGVGVVKVSLDHFFCFWKLGCNAFGSKKSCLRERLGFNYTFFLIHFSVKSLWPLDSYLKKSPMGGKGQKSAKKKCHVLFEWHIQSLFLYLTRTEFYVMRNSALSHRSRQASR